MIRSPSPGGLAAGGGAATCLFLVSDGGGFITGQTIHVNGVPVIIEARRLSRTRRLSPPDFDDPGLAQIPACGIHGACPSIDSPLEEGGFEPPVPLERGRAERSNKPSCQPGEGQRLGCIWPRERRDGGARRPADPLAGGRGAD